jgi:hypothetical protein
MAVNWMQRGDPARATRAVITAQMAALAVAERGGGQRGVDAQRRLGFRDFIQLTGVLNPKQ